MITAAEPSFWTNVGIAIGSVIAGAGGLRIWQRRDSVDKANASLDVTALTAGSAMITALQGDIARLRSTMVEADTKWRNDMDALEKRLQAMSATAEQSITARRAAEDAASRLRHQLLQLGQTPVA